MSFDDILSSLKQASDRNHFPLTEKIDERFIFRSGQVIDRGLYESMQAFSDLSDLKQSLDRASLVLIADETKRLSHANEKFCQRSQYHPTEIVGCAGLFFNAIESYAGFFVECYPSQLNQALMNLLCNAIESFEPSFILTHPAIVKERRQIEVRLLASDRCATIEIIDNGSGIPDSIQAYIFDPFFTTKPVGQSKGLGLSLAYQIIVGRHGGTLTFESQPGRGTRFVMSIPLRQT
jgi:signal transduction histidine kinase